MTEQENPSSEPLTYAQVQELLPGFAMGALDVHEMQAVELYLQNQEQLLRRRYDVELASQALAYGAAPRPLSAAVKQRLMERVKADAAAPRRMPFAAASTSAATPTAAPLPFQAQPRRRSGSLPLFPEPERSHRAGRMWVQGLLGVAALAATAILLFANWQLQTANEQLIQQVATVNTQLENTQDTLTQKDEVLRTVQAEVAQNSQQIAAIQAQAQTAERNLAEVRGSNQSLQQEVVALSEENRNLLLANRFLTLVSAGPAGAEGRFIVTNNQAYLAVRGLAPLPADQEYQLWYIPNGEAPRPADLFQVEQQDLTTLTVSIPPSEIDFSNIGVSIEPKGGSETPTELVLIGA